MNICLLIISAVIINISFAINCIESDHSSPCQCSLSRYGCDTNINDCIWSFSKCVDSSSINNPSDPISTTLLPLGNIFPTGDPIFDLKCGDQVSNFWRPDTINFTLTISTDIPSIIIDACLSDFDTILKLFSFDDLSTPIAVDDNGCIDITNNDASYIDYTPPNGEVIKSGLYLLELSSNIFDEGIYNINIECGSFSPSKSPTPRPTRSPSKSPTFHDPSKPSKDDSDSGSGSSSGSSSGGSISDSDDQEWWMPTPRPTKGIIHDPNECKRDCDAFRIKLLYYGKISDYNTDTIYYDTIDVDRRRRMKSSSSIFNRGGGDSDDSTDIDIDASCYTYQIERLFHDGFCAEKVEQFVLGACSSDYNRVNHQDLDRLILKEYGGNIFNGFSSFGQTEITGIKVDIKVDNEPIEFTLCMNGINDEGYTSDFVKFDREGIKGYLCVNAGNDGLPCLKDEYRNNRYQVQGSLFNAADHGLTGEEMHIVTDMNKHNENGKPEPSDTISNILIVILLLVISVMVFVAIFYLCVSREKSWLHSAVQKWTVSTSLNWTATEDDDMMIIGESSPFADYDGNNSNAECDGISLSSSSLDFDENEHKIELCGMKVNDHHISPCKISGSSSSDKTISSLEKSPAPNYNDNGNNNNNNKHYYKLSMDKPYRYRNKSSINLSGSLLMNNDKIGILKEQMYKEIVEEESDDIDIDSDERKESSASPTSSADVIFKDSTTQSSEDNQLNESGSSSSPTATSAPTASASPPGQDNKHRDVERIMDKVFASKQGMSPSLISMNMDMNMSRTSRSTSIDENDGTTILPVYDEYNYKSVTSHHQSQIYTISESKSVSENDDDDNNNNKTGKIGKSSTNNPNNNSSNNANDQEQNDLTANIINAVRYNGASAYYE